jgi:hypothetical protein
MLDACVETSIPFMEPRDLAWLTRQKEASGDVTTLIVDVILGVNTYLLTGMLTKPNPAESGPSNGIPRPNRQEHP